MRSLVVMTTFSFFLSIFPSVILASTTPDPAIDIERAWTSLQVITGNWFSNSQSQVVWQQADNTRLKMLVTEGGKQRMIGQLIRKENTIIYKFEQEEEKVSLELKQASDSIWIFEAKPDERLRTVTLTLIGEGALKTEIVARSPSGRQFSIQSEISRQQTRNQK